MKLSWTAHCSPFWVPIRLDVDAAVNTHSLASDKFDLRYAFMTCTETIVLVTFLHAITVYFMWILNSFPVTQLISLKLLLTLSWLCEPFHICSACWWAQVSLDLHMWLKMEARVVLNVQQRYMHCNPQFQLGMFITKLWYWLHF